MYDILARSGSDAGAMYEWPKKVIISSRYILPGKDTFREIKIKTAAMLRKMLDPDGDGGEDTKETVKWNKKRGSLLFPLRGHCGRTHLSVDRRR